LIFFFYNIRDQDAQNFFLLADFHRTMQ